jgi:hypothetical protein
MSFLQRELDRIEAALRQPQSGNRYVELYAAQQALAWASEPTGFASPYAMIMGIPGDSVVGRQIPPADDQPSQLFGLTIPPGLLAIADEVIE